MSRPYKGFLATVSTMIFIAGLGVASGQAAEVPVIKGDLGPCSADFTVTDNASKPLFDAKIHVKIVYGFMNKRKTELEIGTNSDGKARIEGLPARVKRPLEFQISHENHIKSVMQDPETECHANFTVTLETQ